MTIVAINTFNIGSTGKIMRQIAEEARKVGIEYYTCCPRARDNYRVIDKNQVFIGNRLLRNVHGLLSRITGLEGWFSFFSTLVFIKKISLLNPDIIHIHNIHGSYINYSLLFKYIKKKKIKTVWTLHDCWAFTGRCPHFTAVKCEKWKLKCVKCPYPNNEYPAALIDTSSICFFNKVKVFSGVDDLTIVTPSEWLASLVKQSFLGVYPVETINNGIDLKVFTPYEDNWRKAHNILEDQVIVLGVAFNWDYRKGLDVFVELSNRLDNRYKIILVGTNEETEQVIPEKIMTIRRTANQSELAEIYSAADVFVNPTREDNYPTVNMEAIACGTPVITFDTGGSPEIIDEGCGCTIPVNDIDLLEYEITKIKRCEKTINRNACIESAKRFDLKLNINKYIDIYQS